MRFRAFVALTFLLASGLLAPGLLAPGGLGARAQSGAFGGAVGLDPSFCRAHNLRQTIVYVDDTILVTGQTGWAVSIYDKLKATLVPGERVTLVELSPANGQGSEIWSGCWPGFSAAEQAKLAQETHFFSRSPLDRLAEQQGYFAHAFGVAAQRIQEKGQRAVAAVTIDTHDPPQKSVLRALASDGARYAHADSTIRAILYSDLAENSDLASVFKPLPDPPQKLGERLGTYLRRSVFYAFGVGNDIRDPGGIRDTIRQFWDEALRSMAGNLGGFGSDLTVPNLVPVTAQSYDLSLTVHDQKLVGRLSLLADAEGTLVDSWLGITRLRNAALNGTYRCVGSAEAPSCSVQARTAAGIVTTGPAETLTLSSHGGTTLAGTIGVPGSDVNVPLAATPTSE